MRMTLEDLPGHEGSIGARLADGSLTASAPESATPIAFCPLCSCGWTGSVDYPPTEEGRLLASSEWGQHMKPFWAAAAPGWLLDRSAVLRDSLAELATEWPLQALGVLAEVECWQKPLIEDAVVAAREAGSSWSEIGAVLGITKQSAHERFSAAAARRKSTPSAE